MRKHEESHQSIKFPRWPVIAAGYLLFAIGVTARRTEELPGSCSYLSIAHGNNNANIRSVVYPAGVLDLGSPCVLELLAQLGPNRSILVPGNEGNIRTDHIYDDEGSGKAQLEATPETGRLSAQLKTPTSWINSAFTKLPLRQVDAPFPAMEKWSKEFLEFLLGGKISTYGSASDHNRISYAASLKVASAAYHKIQELAWDSHKLYCRHIEQKEFLEAYVAKLLAESPQQLELTPFQVAGIIRGVFESLRLLPEEVIKYMLAYRPAGDDDVLPAAIAFQIGQIEAAIRNLEIGDAVRAQTKALKAALNGPHAFFAVAAPEVAAALANEFREEGNGNVLVLK